MGVAVSVTTSTVLRSCLIRSLWATPKSVGQAVEHPVVLGIDGRRGIDLHDVDAALGEALAHRAGPRGGAKPRQRFDLHGVAGEALPEGGLVLLAEDRRGHQHGDLLAVHHGAEGGAHRDLGLAVADVAADEAVHRLRPLHVVQHVFDRVRAMLRSDFWMLRRAFSQVCPPRRSMRGV